MPHDKQKSFQGFKPGSEELAEFARSCWAKEVEVFVGSTRHGDPVPGAQDKWEWTRSVGTLSLAQQPEFQTLSFEPVEAEYVLIRIKSNWGGGYVCLGEVEILADGDAPPADAHSHAAAAWPNVAAIGHKPIIVWQLLAYLLLTAAEVMVSITCLEFSYTQAPEKMKSFIMALYLLSISLGNAVTATVNFFIQNEDGTQEEFTEALMAAIDRLERLPAEERGKWEKLIYYLVLLIYHRRDSSEHEELIQQVQGQVRAHNRKEEVANMGQTIAQALIQEGRELGYTEATMQTKQEVLIMLLQTKFGQLPSNIVQRIQNVQGVNQLNVLLARVITANSLEDMEIE
ncbi:hypothetical protein IH992_32530 [Candidatus Poribacteria bacterium]|nr:hypothetical protein [Candidatus Poribacteria bacterium]